MPVVLGETLFSSLKLEAETWSTDISQTL